MKLIYLSFFVCFFSFNVNAINISGITSIMSSHEDKLVKKISNDTNEARAVFIDIVEISEPTEKGIVINRHPKELLLTPSKIILPAKSDSIIKFLYNGPKDNKERYYRIIWKDSNISLKKDGTSSDKQAIATASAIIGTILVVTPRVENFDFEFTKDNILINKGNSSYHVISYGPCKKNKGERCKEDYYDLPGKKRKFRKIDINSENSFIAIWHGTDLVKVK